jgi:hypothetical protein
MSSKINIHMSFIDGPNGGVEVSSLHDLLCVMSPRSRYSWPGYVSFNSDVLFRLVKEQVEQGQSVQMIVTEIWKS